MIVFTVHEKPDPPADRIDRAEKLEFIRDGFTPLAAALPPLWMVMNGLWIVLLLYLLGYSAVGLILAKLGVAPALIGLITLAANVLIGFEADSLKRWTYQRRGWSEIGTVVGRNRAECERRFFDGWLAGQPMLMPRASAGAQSAAGSADLGPRLPNRPAKLVGAAAYAPPATGQPADFASLDAAMDGDLRPTGQRWWHRVTGRK
jgi:Protein of unknown function (DUF2628)